MADATSELQVLLSAKDEASDKINSFGDSLKSVGEIAAGLGLEELGQKLLDVGKDAAEFAINYGANLEQNRIAFNAFTGSVEKGGEALTQVAEFARKTPFTLPQVEEAGRQILGFGLATADANTKLAETATQTQTVSHYVDAYGQTVQKVSKENSKVLDDSNTKLKEQNAQLAILEEEHPKAGVATDKHNLAVMRLKDSIAKTTETIGQHTLSLKTMQVQSSQTADQGESLVDMLRDVGNLASATSQPLSVAVDLFAKAKEGIFNIREFGQFGITRQELEDFGVSFTKAGSAVDKSALLPALEKLVHSRFGDLMAEEAKTFSGTVTNIKDDIGRLAATIIGVNADTGDIVAGGFFDKLKQSATSFLAFIDAHQSQIAEMFQSIGKTIGDAFNTVGPVIETVASTLGTFFDNIQNRQAAVTAVLMTIIALFAALAISVIAATWPIVAITAAVAGLAFAHVELNTKFNEMISKSAAVKDALAQLQQSYDNTRTAAKNLKDAQDNLNQSHLDVEGATLNVEQATNTYSDSLKKNGAQSLITRQAAHDLKEAKQELKDVQDKEKDATDNVTKAQQDLKKQQDITLKSEADVKKANEDTANSFDRIRDAIGGAISNYAQWLLKTAGDVAFAKFGHNAQGTSNWRGGLTWVGEQGPELVNLPQGAQVFSNSDSRSISNRSSSQSFTININNPTVRSDDDIRSLADQVIEVIGRQNELSQRGVAI